MCVEDPFSQIRSHLFWYMYVHACSVARFVIAMLTNTAGKGKAMGETKQWVKQSNGRNKAMGKGRVMGKQCTKQYPQAIKQCWFIIAEKE